MPYPYWPYLIEHAKKAKLEPASDHLEHQSAFEDWISLPLRLQAQEIRRFVAGVEDLDPSNFREDDWRRLIPKGEPEHTRTLFLLDLESLFRVLSPKKSGSTAETPLLNLDHSRLATGGVVQIALGMWHPSWSAWFRRCIKATPLASA